MHQTHLIVLDDQMVFEAKGWFDIQGFLSFNHIYQILNIDFFDFGYIFAQLVEVAGLVW